MGLKIENVSHNYFVRGSAPIEALVNVSLMVAQDEVVVVVGRSGCGKTTLLNIIAGLLQPMIGQVAVDGDSSSSGQGLGYMFQRPRLLPWRTVRENVSIPLFELGLASHDRAERVEEYLRMVDLWEFRTAYPGAISGGMQQRVSIARALAIEPVALIMDEPFSSLDEFTARSLRADFLSLVARRHQSVLFVTHNIAEAAYLADRVIVLSSRPGKIIAELPIEATRPREWESETLFEYQRMILGMLDIEATE